MQGQQVLRQAAGARTGGRRMAGSFTQVLQGCLVQGGNDVELDTVGRYVDSKLYRWRPCGGIWDSSPEQSW